MASNALAALAYGLRNAGGVLNKDVQTQLAQEQMQEDARADRRKDLITSLAIKAAQDGSANPAAVQATLAAQGIQVPSEFVGPSAETRARTAALENEQAFRAEWAKLAPDASLYDRANIAAKYGKPELSVQLYTKEQERLSREQARKDSLEQRQYEVDARLMDKALDRESRERLQQQSNDIKLLIANQNAAIARSGQDLRLAMLDFNLRQKTDEKTRGEVQKLGAALEKANLPESDAVLGAVEKALEKTPSLGDYLAGPKSAVPDIALRTTGISAEEAQAIREGRQAFQKLFNITLKNRSGAAVTIPEFERLKKEFATGVWKDPKQLEAGVKQAREIIQKHYASVAAGFGKDTLKAYNDNLQGLGLGRVINFGGGSSAPAADDSDPLGLRK
jgi:hypothetical protein